MASVDSTKPAPRCHSCGRDVVETVHTRVAYRVGYYALHTGDVEPTTMARPDDPSEQVTVLRLVRPIEVYTCVDCYRQPSVRSERDLLFRPELAESGQVASKAEAEG